MQNKTLKILTAAALLCSGIQTGRSNDAEEKDQEAKTEIIIEDAGGPPSADNNRGQKQEIRMEHRKPHFEFKESEDNQDEPRKKKERIERDVIITNNGERVSVQRPEVEKDVLIRRGPGMPPGPKPPAPPKVFRFEEKFDNDMVFSRQHFDFPRKTFHFKTAPPAPDDHELMHHLHAAIHHLHRAGLHREADRVAEHLRESTENAGMEAPLPPRKPMGPKIRKNELREEIESLRRELEELKSR